MFPLLSFLTFAARYYLYFSLQTSYTWKICFLNSFIINRVNKSCCKVFYSFEIIEKFNKIPIIFSGLRTYIPLTLTFMYFQSHVQ